MCLLTCVLNNIWAAKHFWTIVYACSTQILCAHVFLGDIIYRRTNVCRLVEPSDALSLIPAVYWSRVFEIRIPSQCPTGCYSLPVRHSLNPELQHSRNHIWNAGYWKDCTKQMGMAACKAQNKLWIILWVKGSVHQMTKNDNILVHLKYFTTTCRSKNCVLIALDDPQTSSCLWIQMLLFWIFQM